MVREGWCFQMDGDSISTQISSVLFCYLYFNIFHLLFFFFFISLLLSLFFLTIFISFISFAFSILSSVAPRRGEAAVTRKAADYFLWFFFRENAVLFLVISVFLIITVYRKYFPYNFLPNSTDTFWVLWERWKIISSCIFHIMW